MACAAQAAGCACVKMYAGKDWPRHIAASLQPITARCGECANVQPSIIHLAPPTAMASIEADATAALHEKRVEEDEDETRAVGGAAAAAAGEGEAKKKKKRSKKKKAASASDATPAAGAEAGAAGAAAADAAAVDADVASPTGDEDGQDDEDGAAGAADGGKKKKKRSRGKKKGGAAGASAAGGSPAAAGGGCALRCATQRCARRVLMPCPAARAPSVRPTSRLLGGFADYYVKYGQTYPPTIPVRVARLRARSR